MYQNFLDIPFAAQWWVSILFVWVFIWKGLALWKSARLNAKWWFIALLVVNTLGVLEILYIYVFSEKKLRMKMNLEDRGEEKHHPGHPEHIGGEAKHEHATPEHAEGESHGHPQGENHDHTI